jgi:hypothetical protein
MKKNACTPHISFDGKLKILLSATTPHQLRNSNDSFFAKYLSQKISLDFPAVDVSHLPRMRLSFLPLISAECYVSLHRATLRAKIKATLTRTF